MSQLSPKVKSHNTEIQTFTKPENVNTEKQTGILLHCFCLIIIYLIKENASTLSLLNPTIISDVSPSK